MSPSPKSPASFRALAWSFAVLLTSEAALAQSVATPESFCTSPPAASQEKVRKELGDGFAVVETKHFRLISDCCPRYRKLVAGSLEQFYTLVHPKFFKKEMKPVTVYLIDASADYESFCKNHGHESLASSYGLYVPEDRSIYTRRLMPDGTLSGMGTLFHEAIHAMVHADFPSTAPTWFDEGFASLFEQGRIINGAWVYGNPNPWREAPYREAFEGGRIPPLTKYLVLSDKDFRGPDQSLNYNTGRSLCLWLLRSGEEKLAKFVDLVRQKKSGVAALEAASGKKIADAEKAWREHVKKVNFAGAYVYRAQKAKGDEALKILAEGVEKHPDCGMLRAEYAQHLSVAGKAAEAQKEAEAALQDPRLPNPGLAWSVLRWCHGANDLKKSGEAARKIVELQPWMEILDEKAFTTLKKALEAEGKSDEAARVDAELTRLKEESERTPGR